MLRQRTGCCRLVDPRDLLVGKLAARLLYLTVELALHQAIDVAVGKNVDLHRFADRGRIGQNSIANLRIGVLGQQVGCGARVGLVGRIDAEQLVDGALGNFRVVRHQQIVVRRCRRRAKGALIENDIEAEGRLREGRIAAHHKRREERDQEGHAEENGADAVDPEAALGSVTLSDAALDGFGRALGHERSRCHRSRLHSHYSYCSLYLRTI